MSVVPLYKLELLKYPRVGNFAAGNADEVVALVAFLEDRHVRLWPIEKRAPLRKSGPEWPATFAAYLQDAECPLVLAGAGSYAADRAPAYLSWLVGRAVSLGFEDRAQDINAAAAAELARGAGAAAPAAPPLLVPPAADAAVRELAALLDVNVEGRDALQALQAVHRTLRQRVLPAAQLIDVEERDRAAAGAAAVAAADAAAAAASAPAGSAAAAGAAPPRRVGIRRPAASITSTGAAEVLDLARFPLGFSTGSAVTDAAAALLRMLYIADLRELQDAVNDILVTVQEWTANPKTDASLGQVGR